MDHNGTVTDARTPDPRWSARHFSLANPRGPGQADVPALLRRVADSIERLGRIDVQDITFHPEMDDGGVAWPTVTVYYQNGD